MRVAALCDIHGNLPALRAVLADAEREGVDTFVIGGDVAPGPLLPQAIEDLTALGGRAHFVRGNGDREAVEAFDAGLTDLSEVEDPAARAAIYMASQISRSQRDFLAGFAPTVRLVLDDLGPILFCHGSPRSDTEIITRITPDERLQEILSGVDERIVVGGHTHQQFDRSIDGSRFVNAGSVGMPYEGSRGAYWALLDSDVELRRTEYDLDQALAEMREAEFPDLEEMLKESLLDPMDPGEIAQYFENRAGSGQRDEPDL
jgi:predicted phosphodiesterase